MALLRQAAADSWGLALTGTCLPSGDLGRKVLPQIHVTVIFIMKSEQGGDQSLSGADLGLFLISYFSSWGQGSGKQEAIQDWRLGVYS